MIKFKSQPIEFPTLESEVLVIVTDSLVETAQELNIPNWTTTDDEDMDAYCITVKKTVYIIYKDDVSFRTILHEPIHAINQMYQKVGASVLVENDEIYIRDVCYLQEKVYNLVKNEIKY